MDLSQVRTSTNDGPARIGMHAQEGVGKTTLAANFPKPLIVGAENGVPRDLGFNVGIITPRSWLEIFDLVDSIEKDKHEFQTLVFDTVDWIEPMIHRFVTERDSKRQTEMNPKGRELVSIEDYGYGKGYLVAEEEFRKLISALDIMQSRRFVNVVMLMHSHVKPFKNPAGPDFDRYQPKCQERVGRVVVEWVENLLFGFFQVDSSKISEDVQRNEKTARAKGIGGNQRVLGCQRTAMYDAKNRVGLPAEIELPEDLTQLITTLLGQGVQGHGRRAQFTDVSSPQWADQQRAMQGREAQDRAHIEALEESAKQGDREYISNRDEQEGISRSQKSEAPSQPEERKTSTRPVDPNNGRPIPGNNHLTDKERRDRRLANALEESKKKGADYHRKISGWVTKAAGDAHKIDAIIKQAEGDLGYEITAA